MTAFVVALQVQGRRCLVVGGGAEATSKALRLVDAGGEVTVVSREIEAPLELARARGALAWTARGFDPALDLAEPPFVVISTDETAHEEVRAASKAVGALVCCVDAPRLCDFYLTAQGACGPMTLAVASEGRAPMLARRLKEELVRQLDAPMRALGDAVVALRAGTAPGARRAVISKALEGFSIEIRVNLPHASSRDDG